MAVDVSICIATYHRPEGLSRLLDSLERLKIPLGIRAETIVVDNDCDESAASIVKLRSESLRPIHYCVEPHRNIALARNRAVSEASGRWILFIDDDEVADENWLSEHLEFVESEPCDGAFGPVLRRFEEPGHGWIDIETFFAMPRHPTGTVLGCADLRTGNAIVRRRLFERFGFDPAFGRTGGEDSELFGRMQAARAHFLWCDEARVEEFVAPERRRLGWLAQRAFRGGLVYTRIARLNTSAGSVRWAIRALALLCGFAALMPLAAFGGRRKLARVVLRLCTQAGHLWALTGRSYEEYGDGIAANRSIASDDDARGARIG